jgi:carbon-monoxide dehydrogenase large subunit
MSVRIGQPVLRLEDHRLLRGLGRYVDDIVLPRQAHACFLRSPHAHARIAKIDATKARKLPGVIGILLGRDLAAAGIGDVPCMVAMKNRDGSDVVIPPRPAIAVDTVRFVGDTVALVVAETVAAAKDAAELIEVDYEAMPAVVDLKRAAERGAPQLWPHAKGNVAVDWTRGEEAPMRAAFAKAARVVAIDIVNNRLVTNSIEPRMAIGDYSSADGRYALYCGSQGGNRIHEPLASLCYRVPFGQIRVVTPDVGGGFGMKNFIYPEYVALPYAAKLYGRPIKWCGERGDAFLTDTHGRDHVTHARLALDRDGKFLALHVTTLANLGAYLSHYAPFIPTGAGGGLLTGCYDIPAAFVEVKGIYTNTTPVDAYRGAGRPEAAYVIERVVGEAARVTGLAPDEIRRRNFIRPEQMPYRNPLASTYDSGEFQRNMEQAMRAADWSGFAARKQAAAARGRLRGIGLAYYIEVCGGAPGETASVAFERSGRVTLLVSNKSNGQGHETAYAQIAAARLGLPMDRFTVLQGDSDQFSHPGGTGGSRALTAGGPAVNLACDRLIVKAKQIAALMLEAAPADIEFKDGVLKIAGTDRSVALADVAQKSYAADLPPDILPGLDGIGRYTPAGSTYSNGCHIAELEIDPDTGTPRIERYTIVDDMGRVINPLTMIGQIHGGTAQGIGQALCEDAIYDSDSGQLLTGSFMDYWLPRASDVPMMDFANNEILTKANPLGVKGAGEAGAIGAPPAVIAAVLDALAPLGIHHIDMPATPHRIWSLIQGSRRRVA